MCYLYIFVYILMGLVSSSANQCLPSGEYCSDRTISRNGTIKFAVFASIHEPSAGKYCGSISPQGFQTSLAIEWITDYLRDYIPGIDLGFDIYDDCGLPTRATDAILDVLPGGKQDDLLSCDLKFESIPLAGVIGLTTLESTTTLSTIIEPETPFISAHARSPSLEMKENIMFTIPSIKEEVKATFDLLLSLQWYYVVLVHTDEEIGKLLLEELKNQQKSSKIYFGGINQIAIKNLENIDDVKNDVTNMIDDLEKQQNGVRSQKMGVVYLGSTTVARYIVESIIEQKSNQARDLQWVMLSNVNADPDIIQMIQASKENEDPFDSFLLTVSQHGFLDLSSFQDYFIGQLESSDTEGRYSPWKDKYLSKVYPDCMPSCTRQELITGYRQDVNTVSAAVAVMVMASALKSVHSDICGTESGLCTTLKQQNLQNLVLEKLKTASLSLTEDMSNFPDEFSSLNTSILVVDRHYHIDRTAIFTFFRYDSNSNQVVFNQIGNSMVGLTEATDSPSICREKCDKYVPEDDVEFAYVDGDILILGFFSVHESEGDFRCGEFRQNDHSIVTALAFIQAIKNLPPINGKTIGGLAFDDCYAPLRTSHFLTELFSGKTFLQDPLTRTDIDMSKVRVVIGALSSDVTLAVVDVLTHLNIPMVSYSASSAFLDSRRMYPYFLRTVPSDKLQADGIVDLLRVLNFTFTGAIYIDDAYGYNGILDVEGKANENGICIVNKQEVTESYQSYSKIEETLKKDVVEVVVFYGIDTIAEEMLQSFQDSYIYIASEAWGTNPDLITHANGQKNRGSLIFQTDTSYHTDEDFKAFLTSITPTTNTSVPWMERFWEEMLECDFPWSTDKRYINHQECDMNARISDARAEELFKQQRVVHVSHAVSAVWKGCSTSGKCTTSTLDKDYAVKLTEDIKKVVLTTVDGQQFKLFKDDGNGYMGLSIFNIQQEPNGNYNYTQVGTYSEAGRLVISMDKVRFYDEGNRVVKASDIEAKCNQALCGSICMTNIPVTTQEPSTQTPSPTPFVTDNSMETTVIVLAVIIGCMFILMLLLVIFLFRQHNTTKKMSSQKHSLQSHTASMRSLDNMYEEVGISNGTSNRAFDHRTSNSSGFNDGSSGFDNSMKRGASSIKYSDVQLSLPDLTRPTINLPQTASSSNSGSGGDASSVPSRSSRTTDRNTGMSDHSSPLSQRDKKSLTYMTAKDFDLVDEEVMDTHPSYLDLSNGGEDPGGTVDESSTLPRKALPPQSQAEFIPPSNPSVIYRPQRPNTLPVVNTQSLSPREPSINLVNSAYLQTPSLHLPTPDQQQAMYLHAIGQDKPSVVVSSHPVTLPVNTNSSLINPNQMYIVSNGNDPAQIMYLDPVQSLQRQQTLGRNAQPQQPLVLYDMNGVPHEYLPQSTNISPVNYTTQRNIPEITVSKSPVAGRSLSPFSSEQKLGYKSVPLSSTLNKGARVSPGLSPPSEIQKLTPRMSSLSSGNSSVSQISPVFPDDDDGEVIII